GSGRVAVWVGVAGGSVLHRGFEVEGVVGAVVVVVVEVGVEVGVGADEVEAGGFVGVVFVAEGALQAFDAAVALGALWGDGDEFEAEGGAGAFEVATELAAVVDLDASDAVGPALEAFAEETLGVAAVGAGEEAGVRELAGRVDGAEVVARREG